MPKRKEIDTNRIVRAIFGAAEAMGISDRKKLEDFARQVLQRSGIPQPLPGLEEFLPAEVEIPKRVEMPEVMIEAPSFSPTALKVLERRYLKRDNQGRVIETVEEMFRRVAKVIASAESYFTPLISEEGIKRWEEEFYQMMSRLEFLPNSPTLMNAGRELGQLSACFVLPVEDSMESIFEAVKLTALIHKSGGGTGFNFSKLRPENDKVGSTGGVASGPVSFMKAFDTATEVIKQGGMRRGANMGILNYNHPDIMKFITAKQDPTAFTNFNISVAVSEEFFEKVKRNEDYELINPRTGELTGKLNAREVFDKIAEMAWRTGDPGLVFLDRVNKANPTPQLGAIESTNPCGEQPLLPYESCNLSSINLSKMVTHRNGRPQIDYPKLEQTVKKAVRFLDNVIEVNRFPIPEIEEKTKLTRKIGLGVMGFADMLILLGIPYDSQEAVRVAEEVMEFISRKADEASQELARERGAFPGFRGSIYDRPGQPPLRNATRTTIAPTGTISLIAGCSSGIEPIFALVYKRYILEGGFFEVHSLFEKIAKEGGFYSQELIEALAEGKRLKEIANVPEDLKRLFITAHEVPLEQHIKIQAAFQKYVGNAVSKTINLPHEATIEDVKKAFMLAYEYGLKGITIFRDRCREEQVLVTGKAERKEKKVVQPRRRPQITQGFTHKIATGCGNLYITVNSDELGICEVFTSLGKAGGCASAQLEAISRLISLALRSGVGLASIIKHLKSIRCPAIAWHDGKAVLSCADALAQVLERYSQTATLKEVPGVRENAFGSCPECGDMLIYQEGCFLCYSCGYTKC